MTEKPQQVRIVTAVNGWIVSPSLDDYGRVSGEAYVFNRFEDLQAWMKDNLRPVKPSA